MPLELRITLFEPVVMFPLANVSVALTVGLPLSVTPAELLIFSPPKTSVPVP